MEIKKLTENWSTLEKRQLYIVVSKINLFSISAVIVLELKVTFSIMLTSGGSFEILDPSKYTGHNFKAYLHQALRHSSP